MATVKVNVVCARDLPSEWFEKTDPYAILKYNGKKKRTKVDINAGKDPNWNQEFTFPLKDPPGTMEIALWDQDVGLDDFLAKTSISIADVYENDGEKQWFELQNKKGSVIKGRIQLEFTVIDDDASDGGSDCSDY